jgi:hypothetical protein
LEKICPEFFECLEFESPGFSIFIPGIDLKGDQYPDHDQEDFPDGIEQIPAEAMPALVSDREEALANLAEDSKHAAVKA